MTYKSDQQAPATLLAQALGWVSQPFHDVAPPVHTSSTFERGRDGTLAGGRLYGRDESPAYDQAEALLARLEGGEEALLFPSGMAAASAVLQALTPGSRVVASQAMYWGLRNALREFCSQWQIALEFVDTSQDDAVHRALTAAPTTLMWLETPANPTWEVSDIAAIAAMTRRAGAVLVVDSTVATPILTQPLALGADIVMHSATKYLNGHSDVLAGALVCRRDTHFWQLVRRNRRQGGAVPGALDAWLLLRGMRTLHLRVKAACANALHLAEALRGQPGIAQVLYPGLDDHPGHAVAARQMKGGFGGMLSLRVSGGEPAAHAFCAHLELFKRATSLGSVESLAEHRAPVEGAGSPCPRDLVRLSIGIEDARDLLDDLLQALARIR